MSSASNGLYFLTLPLVSVMRVIYRKIRHARYLYIKRNVEKVWGARYTLGARYLSKNTSCALSIHQKECRESLGCALYIRCALSIEKYVMRVIYTSKGMSRKFGVRVIHQMRVIYRKIRYICTCNLSDSTRTSQIIV